jgi:hypothetical protein
MGFSKYFISQKPSPDFLRDAEAALELHSPKSGDWTYINKI